MNTGDQNLIDHWVITKNLSEGTQKNYQIALFEFSELNQKTISELKEEAIQEQLQGIWITDRSIQQYFTTYRKNLKERGLAPNTINLRVAAIRSFYDSFEIQLPKTKLKKGDICLEKNYHKLISREEIQRMANAASLRERAIIYLLALSGMSQNEARTLTIRKLIDSAAETLKKDIRTIFDLFDSQEELKKEVITLHLIRKKVSYKYITFIPPEATINILDYLRERIYGRNQDIRIKTIDEPIFVKIDGDPMDEDLVGKNIKRAGIDAGFTKQDGAYAFWRPHSLRKYFISTIINKLKNPEIADFMAGHTIPATRRSYWYVNVDELKEDYLKALSFLSIDEVKVQVIESTDYQELKSIIKEKDEEIKEKDVALEQKENEFKVLSERIDEVTERVISKPRSPILEVFEDEEVVEELLKNPKIAEAFKKALSNQ